MNGVVQSDVRGAYMATRSLRLRLYDGRVSSDLSMKRRSVILLSTSCTAGDGVLLGANLSRLGNCGACGRDNDSFMVLLDVGEGTESGFRPRCVGGISVAIAEWNTILLRPWRSMSSRDSGQPPTGKLN